MKSYIIAVALSLCAGCAHNVVPPSSPEAHTLPRPALLGEPERQRPTFQPVRVALVEVLEDATFTHKEGCQ
jgi:hypothetical protein